MNCQVCQSEMPEILLNPAAASGATVQDHLASCVVCQKEFASFQSTFALLDTWEVPEPSPYFDQKLAVRLREEQLIPQAGWFERLQTRLLFNTGRQFRPALVGTMALVILLGGGTFAGLSSLPSHRDQVQASATVNDLQILDKNDQAFQQMDQLFQDDQPVDDSSAPPRS